MRYLSTEWLAAANDAVSTVKPAEIDAAIGYVITDGPEGAVSYSVVLGPDAVGITAGTDVAGVVLTLGWDLAIQIAQSEASAQRAFLEGSIRVGGDVRVLVGNSDIMTLIDVQLAELRTKTVY